MRARRVIPLGAVALTIALIADVPIGQAQPVTAITSSGLGTLITAPGPGGTVFQITGGTPKGANLFHSFGLFSIGAHDTAQFLNTTGPGVKNIMGRITDGQTSNIFGTIDTLNFPKANLFLINPAGVIFGPTAKLSVDGSFHVSTADYLRFADNQQFFASLSKNSVLTMAAPTAFGFLGPSPNSISIQGATLEVPDGQALSFVGGNVTAQVSPNQTLSVAGGDIAIAGAKLTAPSGEIQLLAGAGNSAGLAKPDAVLAAPNGRMQLTSVTSAGEVSLGPPPSGTGQIALSNHAAIDVSGNPGNPGGSVVIRGGSLFASDGVSITSTTKGSAPGKALGIDVKVDSDIVLSGGTSLQVVTQGSGKAGGIQLTADSLQMETGAGVSSLVSGSGAGGDVMVNARSLSLTGSAISSTTGPLLVLPTGPGGKISITANEVDIAGQGSGLFSSTGSTVATGVGGAITVTASSGTVTLTDGGTIATTSNKNAKGGDIAVLAKDLSLTGGAELKSAVGASGTARGGSVTVTASELATMSGNGTGIVSSGSPSPSGPAGDITVNTGTLVLADRATIQNGNTQRNGGSITITATDSIAITGGGTISSLAFSTDVGPVKISARRSLMIDDGLIQASTIEIHRAGDITVTVGDSTTAGNVTLTNGAQIATSSDATAEGGGGNLTLTATGAVFIGGRAPGGQPVSQFSTDPKSLSNDPSSGLFSTADGRGPGGQIAVSAPRVIMENGGKISVSTEGTKPAGNIDLSVGDLQMTRGARIDSSSTGSAAAAAGDVNIHGVNTLRMSDSSITTEATVAPGGDISIFTAGSLIQLVNSQITTSVHSGSGQGGNITIGSQQHPVGSLVLDNSQILANAFGGPGGNIDIVANIFLTSDSLITASSALSEPGTINIQAATTNVSGTLARLPESLLQAATLLRASCAARVAAGKASSLVVSGRGGLPLEPGGLVPSPLLAEASVDTGLARNEGHVMETLPRFSRSVLAPMCSR